MKKRALFFLAVLFSCGISAQRTYWGASFDYTTSLQSPKTFAVGLDFQSRLRKSNWYLNWHYSIGQNSKQDMYARANITLLLYCYDDWWTSSGSSNDVLGEVFVKVFGPVICPVGVTYYFYSPPTNKVRLGLYASPLLMDHWDKGRNSITSWSVEGGIRVLYNISSDKTILFSAGGTQVTNIRSYAGAANFNRSMLSFSIGILQRGPEEW
jgi:hypothetical protein